MRLHFRAIVRTVKENQASKNSLIKVGLIAREFSQSPSQTYLFPKANAHMVLAMDNFVYDLLKEFDAEIARKQQQYIDQRRNATKTR